MRILLPPRVVHRPVACAPPGIVTEGRGFAVALLHLRAVEVVALGSQTSLRTSYLPEQVTTYVGRFCPEITVLRRSPTRPQLVKRRQVIRGIRESNVNVRDELDHTSEL